MEYENVVKQLVARSPFLLAQARKMSGSSEAALYRINTCVKVGNPSVVQCELETYHHCKTALGESYSHIFPEVREIMREKELVALEIEYLGDRNLEDVIFNPQTTVQQLVDIIHTVVHHLNIFYAHHMPVEHSDLKEELFSGLVHKVGAKYQMQLLRLKERLDGCSFQFRGTLCHRDLSVVNIIIGDNGQVRFIDPCFRVPGSTEGLGRGGTVYLDCIALLISLTRKSLERQKLGFADLQSAITPLSNFAESFKNDKSVSRELCQLAALYYYGAYVGCACDYCLAPERRWLWERMRLEFENLLEAFLA